MSLNAMTFVPSVDPYCPEHPGCNCYCTRWWSRWDSADRHLQSAVWTFLLFSSLFAYSFFRHSVISLVGCLRVFVVASVTGVLDPVLSLVCSLVDLLLGIVGGLTVLVSTTA